MTKENIPEFNEKAYLDLADRINEALSKDNFSLATKLSEVRQRMYIKYLVARDLEVQE
jgi:hypothetical protein